MAPDNDRVDRVTAAITGDLGLGVGDHGAIVASNSIEYMEIVIGASQAGVALATINPKLAPAEIVAICEDAAARVLFVDAASAEMLADSELPSVDRVIVIEKEFDDWLGKARPDLAPPQVDEWGTFTIPYTSGTTGKPKGVLVPHRSRILSMFAMASEYGCYSPDDRFLAIAPMCHGAGMIFSLAPVFLGGYAEIMDKFDPEQVMVKIKAQEMTGFFGVPTHFHAMFSLEKQILEAHRPTALTTVISNAAALPQAMKETLVDYFGPGILHETYGSTEAGIVTNLRPADQLRKKACVGQPIAGTLVKVLDDEGQACGPDEVGELFPPVLICSMVTGSERRKRPKRFRMAGSRSVISCGATTKGIFILSIARKDMVISGGINVYPREIEEVLFAGIRKCVMPLLLACPMKNGEKA